MTDLTYTPSSLDDFFDVITMSDDERIEMVQNHAASSIDVLFEKASFDIMMHNYKEDFAPDDYLSKLYNLIENEKAIIEGLHSDLYKLQLGQPPLYYMAKFLNDKMDGQQSFLQAATEIGLCLYLSESILSYAYRIRERLLSITGNETKRLTFCNIYLKPSKVKILFEKLKANKQIDSNYKLSDFQILFSNRVYEADKPKKKIKWVGKVIDLALLLIYLSDNHPEWLVAEKVFGVKSTSLKSSLTRLKKNLGYNKKYHDIVTEYIDVK
ncbi:MAG: hypothetical protein IJS63_09105 [Bacteroidaceae bacterium]|nr:hypothetical protein [Bacteroidaceae bacterium]